jgi:hypothetical protein
MDSGVGFNLLSEDGSKATLRNFVLLYKYWEDRKVQHKIMYQFNE